MAQYIASYRISRYWRRIAWYRYHDNSLSNETIFCTSLSWPYRAITTTTITTTCYLSVCQFKQCARCEHDHWSGKDWSISRHSYCCDKKTDGILSNWIHWKNALFRGHEKILLFIFVFSSTYCCFSFPFFTATTASSVHWLFTFWYSLVS